jgi:hypothetical protein
MCRVVPNLSWKPASVRSRLKIPEKINQQFDPLKARRIGPFMNDLRQTLLRSKFLFPQAHLTIEIKDGTKRCSEE